MTDHAKSLADALRDMLVYDLNGETAPFRVRAKDALAAYDARPQASGDLVERVARAMYEGEYGDKRCEFPPWEKVRKDYWLKLAGFAAEALSRAPQPFTAEEWKELAERHSGHGFVTLTCKERNQLMEAARAPQPDADNMLTPGNAWNNLCEKDDRTSPEDYPDHCLITKDELAYYMRHAAPQPDTVTEEMVEAAIKKLFPEGAEDSMTLAWLIADDSDRVRAALTAALAVKAAP